MARLSRTESQAQTRARLLTVARTLFLRDGYTATSLERIAEEAGFSKGAVYSNFKGKEPLFLEVLEVHGRHSLNEILTALAGVQDLALMISCVSAWADRHSRDGNWSTLILEYASHTESASGFLKAQEAVLLTHWKMLGTRLLAFRPELALAPETLGALVFELTYAPAMSFVETPTAGDLLRVALAGVFGQTP